MNGKHVIRQTHRWLSITFTVAVIVNFIALATGKQSTLVGFLALVPLFLLMFSGLYLFVLPYASKGRSARETDETEMSGGVRGP